MLRPNCEVDVGSNVKGEEMFIRPIKFSLVVVSPRVTPLGGGLDAPGIGTASKEGGARTGGGMAFCAGSAGDKNVDPTDFLPLGGVDIAYEVRSPIRMRSVSRGNECFFLLHGLCVFGICCPRNIHVE